MVGWQCVSSSFIKYTGDYNTTSRRTAEGLKLADLPVRKTKGMSVSLSIDTLPDFRKPPAFGGIGRDPP